VWTYRFDIIDGPARAGAMEFNGSRYDLPVVIDTRDTGSAFRVIPISGDWRGAHVRMERTGKERVLPGPLVEAHKRALTSLGARFLFPAVTSTDIELVGSSEGMDGPMEVLVLPHFPIIALDPRQALTALMDLRAFDPVHPPLMVPTVPNQANLELLLHFGLEIFDTISFRMDGARSSFHSWSGPVPYERISRYGGPSRFCDCSACRSLEGEKDEARIKDLIGDHNVNMMVRRLFHARSALEEGRSRELVMKSLAGNPGWLSALRSVESRADDLMLDRSPSWRGVDQVRVTYREDLNNPDFRLWAKRLKEEYIPLDDRSVLLLLPCSARKPYSISRTHQRIRDALKPIKGWRKAVQQVVLTSPLGGVPMELEDLYPASHYDIPVTGEWFPEEIQRTREIVLSILERGHYDRVVSFHQEGALFFPDGVEQGSLGGVPFTDIHSLARYCNGDPFDVLVEHLRPLVGSSPRTGNSELKELLSQIRFSCCMELGGIDGLNVKWTRRGKELRLGKEVLFVFRKGGPVPTSRGGKLIWDMEANGKRVFIDDFKPRGTVFSQGVTGSIGMIRSGDIVLVGYDDDYRGVGRAMVPSGVMTRGVRGPAVQMIHGA